MNTKNCLQPLADRLRPTCIEDFVGQEHLLSPEKSFYHTLTTGRLHSMILWGPPGTGKTTLAKIIANHNKVHFESLSALLIGVKEIKNIAEKAQSIRTTDSTHNILVFIDEIHRFNKNQQDALLPYVESGLFILIGATTENPSFELTNALLSRMRVYVLKKLTTKNIINVIDHALVDNKIDFANPPLSITESIKKQLAIMADGDARKALNLLETAIDLAKNNCIDASTLKLITQTNMQCFDKKGDFFYDQISALHKSVRGSDPDAALYWLARMLDGGCDPLYLARRIVRIASEDIGNADPRALQLALNAWEVQERLGSPEGELALAQAIVYLSCTAKSNAVYAAFKAAVVDAKQHGALEVPLYLRNPSTKLMRHLHCGQNYKYVHDEPDGYVHGKSYFPKALANKQYYFPVLRGLELKIAEKLAKLKKSQKI